MKRMFSRAAAVTGVVALVGGGLLAFASSAFADSHLGNNAGTLVFASGTAGSGAPSWSTTAGCTGAGAGQLIMNDPATGNGTAITDTFTGGVVLNNASGFDIHTQKPIYDSLNTLAQSIGVPKPGVAELVFDCLDSSNADHFTQNAYAIFDASGNWTYSTTGTVSDSRAAATVTVDPFTPNSVASGTPVTLSAHVTGTSPVVGTLQFSVDNTPVGSPVTVSAAGAVTLANVTTGPSGLIHDGAHTVTAAFTAAAAPTSAVKDGADTVGAALNIQGATGENLTVDVQADEGTFTYTVQTSPTVVLNPATGAGIDSKGHLGSFGSGTFNYAAPMNPVTVHDFRQQSKPGWHVNGVVSNFTGVGPVAGKTIPGGDLGWHPIVTSQTSGVTAGPDVAPGSASPTLFGTATGGVDGTFTGGSDLAAAAVGGGQNDTVLNANLSLVVPDSTLPGTYNATLTFTAIDHP